MTNYMSGAHSAGNTALPPHARLSRSVLATVSSSLIALSLSGPVHAEKREAMAEKMSMVDSLPAHVIEQFGKPPIVPTGELNEDLQRATNTIFVEGMSSGGWGRDQTLALVEITDSRDPRLAWPIADMIRFVRQAELNQALASSAATLLNIEINSSRYWHTITDHLIALDIPAPPNYLALKRGVFTNAIPGWDKIFTEGTIDWRHVSWGGVLIDDRAYDTTDEVCNCIPAADNPGVTSAKDAKWLDDDAIVFGVVINDEARAYPRHIMEVREMVNDTLGGRDIGMPYCTLCASAQAYFTDRMPEGVERPVLRTSGLLIRSNKVMYDITSHSVFDTFLGTAVTGPLARKGIKLEQVSVLTTTWADWKKAYPETTVLKQQLALGRNFDFRNGRDANGPIFPVGDVDPRLTVHEDIVGVLNSAGEPVAFQLTAAQLALLEGNTIEFEGIRLVLDGGGIRATDTNDKSLISHQAFWFAWSQFYPETKLWTAAN